MQKPEQPSGNFPRKFGKYHLLAPLAQGGMGALYLAVTGDRGLERLLVIKTVLPHLADSEYLGRFRDEAKVVVQLSHGNLIPVFDAGQVEGEIFLAMEFVEGKDLRAVWNRCAKKGVAFPIDIAVYLIKELSRGLDYAHSFRDLKLVHRDVSPPNVLISYAGEVKLTDWGLASSRLKLEKTAPGIIYGKVAYMSPEQARGESLDGRSDLYAAGIILWELLTGRQLFPPGKDQPQDLIQRARNPAVQAPSSRAPRVPPELDAICAKALSPTREDRYATGEEFRQALSGWLARESPTTDASRMEKFLATLFDEDVSRERTEREVMIQKTRDRALTLPPTHELRKMLEAAQPDRRREADGPNLGRRAPDRGDEAGDRRQPQGGRRMSDRTVKGVAVKVPDAGPGGRTVMTPVSTRADSASMALAAQEEADPSYHSEEIVGAVLDGRYRIAELLGEGGMGRVYLAEHVEIGKKVAVKILHPVYSRMPELVERFRREARAASRIGHPHIVDVTDSGTTADGSVYFVMEYLEGVELASVIDREGALEVTRALKIATQICRALAAAHAVTIIHRDLKPENVFLTVREGTSDFVKVLDFGIAKSGEAEEARSKRLTHPGMAMGTPEYMAPEQAAGKPADERCDIYAVGAILYEMVTGVPPYDGDNFMEILTKKATVEPTPPSQLRPEVPVLVDDLVLHAMARTPEDRPPSMEAFEYELTKCLSGRGAAVAKILGMPTDPALIASLNPGMREEIESNPPDAESFSHHRFGTPTPLPIRRRPPSGPPPMAGLAAVETPAPSLDAFSSAPTAASTGSPMVAIPADVDTSLVIQKTGGGLARVFGWGLFALFLIAGGAAMYYVVMGEAARRDAAPVEPAGEPAEAAGQTPETPEPEPAAEPAAEPAVATETPTAEPAPERSPVAEAGVGGTPSAPIVPEDEEPAPEAEPTEREPRRSPRGSQAATGAPDSKSEAMHLLAEGRAAVSAGQWRKAKDAYERIVRGKILRSQGYLGLAKVAFETKEIDLAIDYARKAGRGRDARMMLGHAYTKANRLQAALNEYEAVLASSPKDKEAQRAARHVRERLGKAPR